MNELYKALEQLVWVGQLGFSLLFPLVCALGGCWWLTRQGVGVMPAAPLAIVWQPKQVILPGEKNSHLYLIQSMLLAVSRFYPAMPVAQVTGTHDAASVAATSWLQEKSGLPSAGAIDQTTWLYLSRLYRISAGDGSTGANGADPDAQA